MKVFENDRFDLTHQGAILWWNLGLLPAPLVMLLNALDGENIDTEYLMWAITTVAPFCLILVGALALRRNPVLSKLLIWSGLIPAFLMQMFWIAIGIFTIITIFSGALGILCCHYIRVATTKHFNGAPVT